MSDVPEGWTDTTLGRVATLVMGQSPPSAACNALGHGLPFFQGNADFGRLHPTPKSWIDEEFKVAEPGDVLLSVRAPVGELNIAASRCVIGRGLAAVRSSAADATFTYYLMHHRRAYLMALGQGSTFDAISSADLRDLPVTLPPLPEQKKVAAILSSVDDAIRATEAVIEQTRRVKQALLQELLTCGIGHTRFKMTEIGEIPVVWDAALVEDVAERGSGHTPDKKRPEYWSGAIKWVSLADTHRLDNVYISETDTQVAPAGIANSSAVVHPAGTVLVSRDASVGRSAIAACELAVSQHFIVWRCGAKLHNLFLYYFLQSHRPRFEQIAAGSTIKTIGLGYFKKLRLPLPPVTEQELIADRLLACDAALTGHRSNLVGLHRVKSALLSALLSGRTRVSV